MIAAKLIDAQGDRLVLVGVLALDHQDGDAVDQEDDVLPVSVPAVVDGELLGHLVDVPVGPVVVDQRQVEFPALGVAIEGCLVTQILQQFAVAEDACLEALKFAGQRPGRFGVFRIESRTLA